MSKESIFQKVIIQNYKNYENLGLIILHKTDEVNESVEVINE